MLAVGGVDGRLGFGAPAFDVGFSVAGHARIEPERGAHVAEVVTVVRRGFAQAE